MRVTVLSFSHIIERRGGAEYQCDIISKELCELGYDVSYVFVTDKHENQIHQGVKLLPIKRKRKIIPGKNHFQYFFSVFKKLSESKPDVIYIRNLNAFIGIAAFYKLYSKTKIALHIAVASDLHKLKYNFLSRYFLSLLLNNLLMKLGIKSTDIVFGQEKWHISKFQDLYGDKGFSFLRVNKLYETQLLASAKRVGSPKNIVWIGNIKPVKRIDLLFDIADELKNEDVIINVIGRNDFNGIEKKEFINKLDYYENVKYHGSLEYDAVLNILSKAHCLAHTSDYEGGAPMVFVESWSLFTPVISLNVNPDNIFENFKNCFSNGDFDDLVCNIKETLNNSELRINNGKIGSKIVKDSFSKNNIVEMINLFKI